MVMYRSASLRALQWDLAAAAEGGRSIQRGRPKRRALERGCAASGGYERHLLRQRRREAGWRERGKAAPTATVASQIAVPVRPVRPGAAGADGAGAPLLTDAEGRRLKKSLEFILLTVFAQEVSAARGGLVERPAPAGRVVH